MAAPRCQSATVQLPNTLKSFPLLISLRCGSDAVAFQSLDDPGCTALVINYYSAGA